MRFVLRLSVIALCHAVCGDAFAAAQIVLNNRDAAGVGFNDTTAAASIGGNVGATVGAQRLAVMQRAADRWAAAIESPVPITVDVRWLPLTCDLSSALRTDVTHGTVTKDFANAPHAGVWYVPALANRYAGVDLAADEADMSVTFNVSIGASGCVPGESWYYGLDGAPSSTQSDMLGYAAQAFARGLGAETLLTKTGANAGQWFNDSPAVFETHIFDTRTSKSWTAMTDSERAVSLVNTQHVIWDGVNVKAVAGTTLTPGVPALHVNSPESAAARYQVGVVNYGSALTTTAVTADAAYEDDTAASNLACSVYDAGVLTGKIALIDRGLCGAVVKTKNAQDAGAVAVVIIDNEAAEFPRGFSGSDPSVTIPTVSITLAAGTAIKTALSTTVVNLSIGLDTTLLNGTDEQGRVLLYAPNPANELSVGRFDTTMQPVSLLELSVNPPSQTIPDVMTLAVMRDIGWLNDADGDGIDDSVDNCPSVANANQADANNDKVGDACAPADGTDGGGDTNGNGQTDGSKKDDGGCAATGAEIPAIALLFSLRALTRRRRNAVADYPL